MSSLETTTVFIRIDADVKKMNGPSTGGNKHLNKMADAQEDFLYEDDFDAVMAIIDADFLQNDDDFNAEVEQAVKNIPSAKESPQKLCNFCEKVCL